VKKHHHRVRNISLFFLILIGIILLNFYLKDLDLEKVEKILRSQGVKGQIIYVAYIVLSIVLSPLSSVVVFPLVLLAYGLWLSVILTFIGTVVGGIINFSIARRLGRPTILHIIGKRAMRKMDKLVEVAGWKELLAIRILGNSLYDFVSYAMGLSKINIFTYIFITLPTSFFWIFILFFIMDRAISIGKIPAIILVLVFYSVSLYITFQIWVKYKRGQLKKKKVKLTTT
jgi:uncharacterized membrane protein YdjX (TVP38/TMEM64 family)